MTPVKTDRYLQCKDCPWVGWGVPGPLPRVPEQKCPGPKIPAALSHWLKEAQVESNLGSNTVKDPTGSTAGGCQLTTLPAAVLQVLPRRRPQQPTSTAAVYTKSHGSNRSFVCYARLTNLYMIYLVSECSLQNLSVSQSTSFMKPYHVSILTGYKEKAWHLPKGGPMLARNTRLTEACPEMSQTQSLPSEKSPSHKNQQPMTKD